MPIWPTDLPYVKLIIHKVCLIGCILHHLLWSFVRDTVRMLSHIWSGCGWGLYWANTQQWLLLLIHPLYSSLQHVLSVLNVLSFHVHVRVHNQLYWLPGGRPSLLYSLVLSSYNIWAQTAQTRVCTVCAMASLDRANSTGKYANKKIYIKIPNTVHSRVSGLRTIRPSFLLS
jgi:hypothetical protein